MYLNHYNITMQSTAKLLHTYPWEITKALRIHPLSTKFHFYPWNCKDSWGFSQTGPNTAILADRFTKILMFCWQDASSVEVTQQLHHPWWQPALLQCVASIAIPPSNLLALSAPLKARWMMVISRREIRALLLFILSRFNKVVCLSALLLSSVSGRRASTRKSLHSHNYVPQHSNGQHALSFHS